MNPNKIIFPPPIYFLCIIIMLINIPGLLSIVDSSPNYIPFFSSLAFEILIVLLLVFKFKLLYYLFSLVFIILLLENIIIFIPGISIPHYGNSIKSSSITVVILIMIISGLHRHYAYIYGNKREFYITSGMLKKAQAFDKKQQHDQAITIYNDILTHFPDCVLTETVKEALKSARSLKETPAG
ncbi:MAG: hypothetical protein GY754_05590 [bacterium]|nr:hypothetical protein [bacterium]